MLIVLGAVLVPLIITQPSRHLLYGTILAYAIIATSLNILTGWAGQLSLGQMAFAGIGAFLAAAFSRGINWDIKIGDTRLYKAGFEGMPFGLSIVLAALVTAAVATIIGVGALRVRGLLLAVVTFAFAHASTQYLFRQRILTGGLTSRIPFPRTDLFGIDLSSQRSIYYLCLAVLSLVLVMVGWLRRTAVGWSTIAVRDNPDTASAYTVRPPIVKLRIFALAGGMAGLGGALLASVTEGFPVPVARYFELDDSLILLSIVVIGGLGSTAGPVLGALWVVGLPAFFPNNPVAPLLTSSVGMLILLMYFPGGLVQVGYAARDTLLGWLDRRMDQIPVKTRHVVPMSLAIDREARCRRRRPCVANRGAHRPLRRPARCRRRLARGGSWGDRRPDRHERRGQVELDERDRWVRQRRRRRPAPGRDRVRQITGGAGSSRPRPDVPGGDVVPGTDGA